MWNLCNVLAASTFLCHWQERVNTLRTPDELTERGWVQGKSNVAPFSSSGGGGDIFMHNKCMRVIVSSTLISATSQVVFTMHFLLSCQSFLKDSSRPKQTNVAQSTPYSMSGVRNDYPLSPYIPDPERGHSTLPQNGCIWTTSCATSFTQAPGLDLCNYKSSRGLDGCGGGGRVTSLDGGGGGGGGGLGGSDPLLRGACRLSTNFSQNPGPSLFPWVLTKTLNTHVSCSEKPATALRLISMDVNCERKMQTVFGLRTSGLFVILWPIW